MANPNLASITTIRGDSSLNLLTTLDTQLIQNAAASNALVKLSSILVSNRGNTGTTVTANIRRSSVDYTIASNIVVPERSTIVIIEKDAPIYMLEGDSLRASAGGNLALTLIANYETLS